MLPIICTAGGSPPISSCPRQSVRQQNTEPQLLLPIRSMTRPLICCNNPSPQMSQHFTRNCHINSNGSQEKVNNNHSSKMVAACSLHNKSAAAALVTATQISYMPQIFLCFNPQASGNTAQKSLCQRFKEIYVEYFGCIQEGVQFREPSDSAWSKQVFTRLLLHVCVCGSVLRVFEMLRHISNTTHQPTHAIYIFFTSASCSVLVHRDSSESFHSQKLTLLFLV